jgi:hypothetical protein
MGGRGKARQPAGTVADDRNGVQTMDVQTARAELDIPPIPRGLLTAVAGEWDEFWASDAALLLQKSDYSAVRRLFLLRDERARCYTEVRKTRKTRVPLGKAIELGLVGELQHEIDDEGQTHSYIEVRHDGRIAIGSQGQMVLSPWARDMRAIDAEIRQLEDRFALNTRARVGIGMAVRVYPGAGAPAAPTNPPPGEEPPDDGVRQVLDIL